jgi:ubiquitin-like 1-activating enzyme E1 A
MSAANNVLSEEERAIYDRQLRVWGIDAQRRLREGRVLIVGCSGLAIEIAKNIVLSGVGHLTLLDDQNVKEQHLVANFAIQDHYVGKNVCHLILLLSQIAHNKQ